MHVCAFLLQLRWPAHRRRGAHLPASLGNMHSGLLFEVNGRAVLAASAAVDVVFVRPANELAILAWMLLVPFLQERVTLADHLVELPILICLLNRKELPPPRLQAH